MGWALGDQKLDNYAAARMQLFYQPGDINSNAQQVGFGRIRKVDRYSETEEGDWALNPQRSICYQR